MGLGRGEKVGGPGMGWRGGVKVGYKKVQTLNLGSKCKYCIKPRQTTLTFLTKIFNLFFANKCILFAHMNATEIPGYKCIARDLIASPSLSVPPTAGFTPNRGSS